MSNSSRSTELESERGHIASLYARLDDERAAAAGELDKALREPATGSRERWQREVSVDSLSDRVRRLRAADNGLCFGRIDREDGSSSYVGRIGLFDETAEYEPLLLDWRAPAARPFYCATPVSPEGVSNRRHFRTRGRHVVDFHDDVLDPDAAGVDSDSDAALLAALNAPREGAMRDIVATIQAEQDEIIRLDGGGVVVVEGGPGTGKTAVALHRVAYLLYTRREQLARRGVLVVGPHPEFVNYIGDVLPSLGETGVVFATPGELMPGLRTTAEDPPEVKRVKGSESMVDVVTAAVADRQELPEAPLLIELEDVTVSVDSGIAGRARQRARASGLLHNRARGVFREWLLAGVVEQAVGLIGEGWLGPDDTDVRSEIAEEVRFELSGSARFEEVLDLLWPELTPQGLLADLFGSRTRLETAGTCLSEHDRGLLYRAEGGTWTVSDVALLDEAVEFLGRDDSDEEQQEREHRGRVEYARGVLEILDTGDEAHDDGEQLRAVDLVDAETLAERHVEPDHRSLAERAAADREWTYGHVVLDEAQELSEMEWRVLVRRCPSRSITVVGDLAQRQSPAGARCWEAVLARHVADRWQYRHLSVNYRTPAEIMELAAGVLTHVDPTLRPPTSVRSSGAHPWTRRVPPGELADAVIEAVRHEQERVGDGTVAVIAAKGLELDIGRGVLTPGQAKGLEFDAVVLAEPQRIFAEHPHGPAQLYVALTRATQRIGLLHTEPLEFWE